MCHTQRLKNLTSFYWVEPWYLPVSYGSWGRYHEDPMSEAERTAKSRHHPTNVDKAIKAS